MFYFFCYEQFTKNYKLSAFKAFKKMALPVKKTEGAYVKKYLFCMLIFKYIQFVNTAKQIVSE